MEIDLTSKEKERLQYLVEHNRKQIQAVSGDINKAEDIRLLAYEGYSIYDPFFDETLRFEVDPVDYYGYKKIRDFLNI